MAGDSTYRAAIARLLGASRGDGFSTRSTISNSSSSVFGLAMPYWLTSSRGTSSNAITAAASRS